MNKKSSKKLKRLAKILTQGKPATEVNKVYKRLKSVHKQNMKQI